MFVTQKSFEIDERQRATPLSASPSTTHDPTRRRPDYNSPVCRAAAASNAEVQ